MSTELTTATNPVLVISDNQIKTSSLDIAEKFGKPHKDVLKAIRSLEIPDDFNERNFAPVKYTDKKGELRPAYDITRDGFTILVMGFAGKEAMTWKIRYLEAFNAMEAELTRQALPNPVISDAEAFNIKKLIGSYIYPSTEDKAERSSLYMKFYRSLKGYFQIPTYSRIPAGRYDEAQQQISRFAATLGLIALPQFMSHDEIELGLLNGESVSRGEAPPLANDGEIDPEFIALLKYAEAAEYMQAFAPDLRQLVTKVRLKVRKAEALQFQLKKLAN